MIVESKAPTYKHLETLGQYRIKFWIDHTVPMQQGDLLQLRKYLLGFIPYWKTVAWSNMGRWFTKDKSVADVLNKEFSNIISAVVDTKELHAIPSV